MNKDFWLSFVAGKNRILFDKPMTRITLPYSHNAGAYTFPFNTDQVGPECRSASSAEPGFAARLMQTQSGNVKAQLLQGGARELDLRACKLHGGPKVFYTENSFLAAPMEEILSDVKDFMEKADKAGMPEPLILNISGFAYARKNFLDAIGCFNEKDHEEFTALIEKYLGGFLFRGKVQDGNLANLSYKELVTRGGGMRPAVYIKYRSDYAEGKDDNGIHKSCGNDDLGRAHLKDFSDLTNNYGGKGILLDCTYQNEDRGSQLELSRDAAAELEAKRKEFFDSARPRVRRFYVDVTNETIAKRMSAELIIFNLEKKY